MKIPWLSVRGRISSISKKNPSSLLRIGFGRLACGSPNIEQRKDSVCLTEGKFMTPRDEQLHDNPGQRMPSEPIATEKVTIDRKVFFLDLKENQRGRFLKITEDVGGRRDTVMLPASAFRDFLDALTRLVDYESKL